jgi:hypothetical protein
MCIFIYMYLIYIIIYVFKGDKNFLGEEVDSSVLFVEVYIYIYIYTVYVHMYTFTYIHIR